MSISGGKFAPYREIAPIILMWCEEEGLNPDCFYENTEGYPMCLCRNMLVVGDGIDTWKHINISRYGSKKLQEKWHRPYALGFFCLVENYGRLCFEGRAE